MEAAEAGHWGHHSHNCLDIRLQLLRGYTSFILYCESKRYIALFNVIVNPHQVCLCPKSKENKSFILNSYFIFIWILIRKKVFLELQWQQQVKNMKQSGSASGLLTSQQALVLTVLFTSGYIFFFSCQSPAAAVAAVPGSLKWLEWSTEFKMTTIPI